MVRRHGWQLPAHPFQVVAITAFFLLAVAFYVFLAPFLGSRYVEYAAIILYSFLAASVFLLYVRCSAIDPADPGVLARFVPPPSKSVLKLPAEVARRSPQHSLSSPSRTKAFGEPAQRVSYGWDVLPAGDLTSSAAQPRRSHLFLTVLPCLLCTWLVCPDNCNGRSTSQQPVADEDILFCTLCNAEVRKHSKHCRSCDKCVDGFDHHCRWLNNCVGKRNYATFVALMSTSLVLLNLQWGIGTAVLVRCFVDRRGIEHQIVEKLGNSFSRPPFAALVAICAAVSFVASIPLGELLFFHMILIRKGISTYEYVIAMRAQADAQGDSLEGDVPSIPSTPASSTATGLSGSSSLGLHNRGAWCTPPKIFVEHQDEVVPHLGSGRIPSTVDPDALSNVVGRELRLQKRPVRISAWKLAKLNADEAARAAVKARENSSVLRYVASRDAGKGQLEYSSSGNLSRVSSASHDHRVTVKDANEETSCHSSQSVWASSHMSRGDWNSAFEHPRSVVNSPLSGANDLTMSPLRTTGRSVPSSSLVLSAPNLSSQQEAVPLSLMVLASSTKQKQPTPDTPGSSMFGAESSSWVDLTAASDGYEASSGESADDLAPQQHHDLAKATQVETKGGWNTTGDSSVDATKIASRAGTSVSSGRVFGTSIFSRSRLAWPDPSASPSVSDEPVSSDFASENFSSSQASPSRQGARPTSPGPTDSDTLRFNGTCIFYGGPLTLDAKMPVLKESAQSLPPRLPLRQQDFRIKFPREANKESRPRIPLRSQSPVFQPHAMPVASSGLGPSGNSQF